MERRQPSKVEELINGLHITELYISIMGIDGVEHSLETSNGSEILDDLVVE